MKVSTHFLFRTCTRQKIVYDDAKKRRYVFFQVLQCNPFKYPFYIPTPIVVLPDTPHVSLHETFNVYHSWEAMVIELLDGQLGCDFME